MVISINQGMMTDLSAVHGISTSGQNLFNSLNYQRFSLNFNSSKFFKNFCEFGSFKPFNDFQLPEKVANSQNYTENNDFLSEKKSNFLSNSVGRKPRLRSV